MKGNTKAEQQAADQKLQAGIQQFLTSPIIVSGKSYTASELGTVIQERIDARNATDVASAGYHGAVDAEATAVSGSKALLEQAKAVLLAMFASNPRALAAMGLSERKTGKTTVKVKAAAAVKAEATREARHTMGPKERLTITGATAGTATATSPASPPGPAPTVGPIATGKAAT